MRKPFKVAILLSAMILVASTVIVSNLISKAQPYKLAGANMAGALNSKTRPDKPTIEPSQVEQAVGNTDGCVTCAGKETTTTPPSGFGKTTIADTSLENAQAEVNFKIRIPSYLPTPTKQKVQLVKDLHNDGKVMASIILSYDVPSADVKLPTGEIHKGGFSIFQIPGEGPKKTLFPTTDVQIDGVTGRVQAPKDVGLVPIQVFWTKDGICYNVVGDGLSQEELIKIARSLK